MKKDVTILNKTGLHARPAALFVHEASKYKCDVKVGKGGREVNAKSIMGVLSLGIGQGTVVTITTSGSDEAEAMEALTGLIESKFGEE